MKARGRVVDADPLRQVLAEKREQFIHPIRLGDASSSVRRNFEKRLLEGFDDLEQQERKLRSREVGAPSLGELARACNSAPMAHRRSAN